MLMLNRFIGAVKHYSVFLSLKRSSAMNQENIYIRFVDGKVDISFLYPVKDNIWRQFNLCRKPNDTLEVVLTRIGSNIEKVVNKKNKNIKATLGLIKFYDCNNEEIPVTKTCSDLFNVTQPQLRIEEIVLKAVINPPWVVSIDLPRSILAGFPVYPMNFVTQFSEKNQDVFIWYRGSSTNDKGNNLKEDQIKWEPVGEGYTYVPSSSDIGYKLKLACTPGNGCIQGPSVETISKSFVEAGPGDCPFDIRHKFTAQKLSGNSFRCVTYNILADLYCDSDYTRSVLYPYCPSYALHIDYRKQLIIKELLGYNADIMCLQEVDKKIFLSCLEPIFTAEKIDGIFYKKDKEVAEGLACFFRTDRFSLLSSEIMCYSKEISKQKCFEQIWHAVKENEPLLERFLDRASVASATILQSKDNPEPIVVVGNTHLYFHPDADHIRLVQGGMFIYWLRDVVEKVRKKWPTSNVSLILCGDFNSVPSCGIYQLYTTGQVPQDLPDWLSNESEAVKGLSLKQDIPLASACGTPEFTNFTVGFADCLDYIFYDTTKLAVEQVIPLPTNEELTANTALPSVVFPSDHVSLVADLRFIPRS